MAAIAGKVAITPKGAWDVATQYEKLDFVLYGDDSYVARKESVGVEPGTDDETWMLSLRGASAQQIQDIINGTTTVGNADKLDGHHAEEFVKQSEKLLTSILEVALTLDGGVHHYYLGGSNYPESEVPKSPYRYGSATIFKRGENAITVALWGSLDTSLNAYLPQFNYYNEKGWTGWQTFLPTTGGTITGELKLKKADNGYTNIFKNNSDTADYGTRIMDYTSDGKKAGIAISATGQLIDLVKNDGSTSKILHTGNKPTGTYTGNGSATSRTISTGGVGSVCVLSNTDRGMDLCIVSTYGALGKSNKEVYTFNANELNFRDGVLTIATDSVYVNGNGNKVKYQVL